MCRDQRNTHPQALYGRKLPLEVSVEGSDVHSSGDVDALCDVVDVLQWSLDTIKDGAHDTWTKLNREGFPCPQHRVSNTHTGWIHAQEKRLDGNVCRTISNINFYIMQDITMKPSVTLIICGTRIIQEK